MAECAVLRNGGTTLPFGNFDVNITVPAIMLWKQQVSL
jgi:hypothetical protein